MKNQTSRVTRGLLLLALVGLFAWTGAKSSFADDHHDAWSHDKSGYWDDHGHHHHFVTHSGHHGYWQTRDNGPKIFVNID